MNTFSIITRTRAKKSGLLPLYFVSTLYRKSKFKSLAISVTLKQWDSEKQEFIGISSEGLRVAEIKQKATTLQLKLHLENRIITQDEFIRQVLETGNSASGTDFYKFIDLFVAQKNYPLKHVKSYDTLKEQLQSFNPYVTFKQINYSFCVGFASYMQSQYKNSNNTRLKKIQYLRCILGEAVKHGHLKTNPAQEVKIKTDKTDRQALSKDELLKLELLYSKATLPHNSQNVLRYFLFCCYTGLRFGDLLNFQTSDIKNGVIKIRQNKTGAIVSIPLLAKAYALLPEQKFKVLSNQKSNVHLKLIKETASIKTNITCHVARHTFATIGLNSGIKLETVSDILGHSSTRVTKIYAKMLDEYRITEMKKWGNY